MDKKLKIEIHTKKQTPVSHGNPVLFYKNDDENDELFAKSIFFIKNG